MIVFEGLSGAGKTTFAQRLAEYRGITYLPALEGGVGSIHDQFLQIAPASSHEWVNLLERLASIKILEHSDWLGQSEFVTECFWQPLLGSSTENRDKHLKLFLDVIDVVPMMTCFLEISHAESVRRCEQREQADSAPFNRRNRDGDDRDFMERVSWLRQSIPYKMEIIDASQPMETVWQEILNAHNR